MKSNQLNIKKILSDCNKNFLPQLISSVQIVCVDPFAHILSNEFRHLKERDFLYNAVLQNLQKKIIIINYKVSEMKQSCYQIRTIIYFQFCCNKSATKFHQIMHTALGTIVISYETAKVCYQKLKNKDYHIQEAKCSNQPTVFMKPACKNLWRKISIQPLDS